MRTEPQCHTLMQLDDCDRLSYMMLPCRTYLGPIRMTPVRKLGVFNSRPVTSVLLAALLHRQFPSNRRMALPEVSQSQRCSSRVSIHHDMGLPSSVSDRHVTKSLKVSKLKLLYSLIIGLAGLANLL